tara:strand:+ start:491 stop:1354 length:864 start_codon:yes stop_codon:yes gene_type:complete
MKVKQIPEDFVVEEVLDLEISEGPYFYYKVKKKNWNTLDLVKTIKNKLKVRDVGFAGLKDRNAVTYQYISVKKKIEFTIKDVEFEYLGRGKKRVYLGKLKGNKFKITIRDLDEKVISPREVLNLFGEQRFGEKNDRIGKLIVQRKFDEACQLLELDVDGNNFVGALRKVGREKLRFYIRAYQSYLWNKLARISKDEFVPLLGFLTEGNDYDKIMKEEGIEKKDFVIRAIPEISSEGSERKRLTVVEEFTILSFEDDELNPGKKKEIVSFFLQKGSYATTVLESLLNN